MNVLTNIALQACVFVLWVQLGLKKTAWIQQHMEKKSNHEQILNSCSSLLVKHSPPFPTSVPPPTCSSFAEARTAHATPHILHCNYTT